MAESFTTTNRFFDNKNYPRGFSRHGDFTIKEAQLLDLNIQPIWYDYGAHQMVERLVELIADVSEKRFVFKA